MKPSPLKTPNLGPPIHSCNTELPSRLNNVSMPVPPFLPTRATTIRRTVEFQSKLHLTSPSSSFSPRRFKNHSAAEKVDVGKWSSGIVEAANEPSSSKLLQVVLVSPQIPGNTGCIARTCAASAVGLHLVGVAGMVEPDILDNALDWYSLIHRLAYLMPFRQWDEEQQMMGNYMETTERSIGRIEQSLESMEHGLGMIMAQQKVFRGLLEQLLNNITGRVIRAENIPESSYKDGEQVASIASASQDEETVKKVYHQLTFYGRDNNFPRVEVMKQEIAGSEEENLQENGQKIVDVDEKGAGQFLQGVDEILDVKSWMFVHADSRASCSPKLGKARETTQSQRSMHLRRIKLTIPVSQFLKPEIVTPNLDGIVITSLKIIPLMYEEKSGKHFDNADTLWCGCLDAFFHFFHKNSLAVWQLSQGQQGYLEEMDKIMVGMGVPYSKIDSEKVLVAIPNARRCKKSIPSMVKNAYILIWRVTLIRITAMGKVWAYAVGEGLGRDL
ncbi:hypothetical protein EJ110_NYTH51502 [Nymphaea thermarum]|nr:hypothetical protein EJ110_NYTH51502 [Nymphaea thermarum]